MTTRHLRVMVHEMWDSLPMEQPGDASIATVKAAALTAARVVDAPEDFAVKFRGAEVRDESQSLADLGVPDDANLIVLRRARRPVR
jgi:predicted lipoprotein